MKHKFKVLTYFGMYVDEDLLPKGVYGTPVPNLHPHDMTIEKLMIVWEKYCSKPYSNLYIERALENMKLCVLTEVGLVTEKELEQIKFLHDVQLPKT